MNLYEYQAKHILRELGFTLPAGVVCDSAEMAEVLAATIDTRRWVVKAQILAGGRARGYLLDPATGAQPGTAQVANGRGGIRFADSTDEVVSCCREMLGATLVTEQTGRSGERINRVYIEESCETERELYLALTVDRDSGELVLIASADGGTGIESAASDAPQSVHRFVVDLDGPFLQTPQLVQALAIDPARQETLEACLQRMIRHFVEKDMLLIEINPLAVVPGEQLVALDATVVFDDNALFRQGHEEQMEAYGHLSELEYAAAVQGLNLVRLDGNIATLSAGAGLAMATIDAICENGGSPANFLDVPPSTAVSRLHKALTLLLSDSATECLLVNVFGGGIMRCDAVADALLLAYREQAFKVPVVVRLAGTNAALGRQRLSASLPGVILAPDLAAAARSCCELTAAASRGGTAAESDSGSSRIWRRLRRLVAEKTT